MTTLSRLAAAVLVCGLAAGVVAGLTASLPINIEPAVSEPLASTLSTWLFASAMATLVFAPVVFVAGRFAPPLPTAVWVVLCAAAAPLLILFGVPSPRTMPIIEAIRANLGYWVTHPGFFLVQIFPFVVGGATFAYVATRQAESPVTKTPA